MFRELVELGRELEGKGRLPPPGFYLYGEPIKWVLHLWPDRVYLEAAELALPRPFSGRASSVEAHLLADEAGYALGVDKVKAGTADRRSPEKHKAFRTLLKEFVAWSGLKAVELREAIGWLETALDSGRVRQDPRFGEILSKDWVSFVAEVGPLKGHHLFEHPEAQAFWIEEIQARSAPGEQAKKKQVVAGCAVCGDERALAGKIPLKVKLFKTNPLHSLNQDAFTSFRGGSDTSKKTHIGICYQCGDSASRAFNFLSNSEQHRRNIMRDKEKQDSLINQIALFWLKAPAPVLAGEAILDLSDLNTIDWGAALQEIGERGPSAEATLSQVLELLKLPWSPTDSTLTLDDYGFYLGVLSPNKGRIALREWIDVSLTEFKRHLRTYLEATLMVSPWGDAPRPLSISTLVQAVDGGNPNHTRGLLRTAYMGHRPPNGLWVSAVNRLRNPNILQTPKEAWRLHALAALLKLGLFFGKEEVQGMTELNPHHETKAYLCGRLLAVLEEAQLRASNFKLNKTLVDRFYGAASTAPATTFGALIRMATTAHLPEIGKKVNVLMEEVMASLDRSGGFPRSLTLAEQAEFGLGFYHQRAKFRAGRGKTKTEGG
ncbi:MAG TPA: type I-C CRISPR-associated protein Cas8c/Csd1 [Sediminispirochaeta sp.]|nr:type I-C CRISPR-associated protein Cas8c/Csd1 [Sediminispirochaeta sp.]